VVYRASLES